MVRMVTPNTNISAGSINTTFLKDKSVTRDKIATTGALDKQVLSYDSATDSVIWAQPSELDNTFENGITVGGATSIFNADVQVNSDIELNGNIAISGNITDLSSITADSSFTLTLNNSGNLTLDPDGYVHADTDNLYVGSFSQSVHITPTSIGAFGTAPNIFCNELDVNNGATFQSTVDVADDLVVTGSVSSKTSTIGDLLISGAYPGHGVKIEAGDTAWSAVTLDEYEGSSATGKPFNNFTNPGFTGQVWGGTVASPAAVSSGRRLVGIYAQGSYDNSGTIQMPSTSPGRLIFSTTETHTSTGRGTQFELQTTPTGSTSRNSLKIQGNVITLTTTGNATVGVGGDEILFDDVISLKNFPSDPSVTTPGAMYFNTSTNKFRGYNGTNWVDLG